MPLNLARNRVKSRKSIFQTSIQFQVVSNSSIFQKVVKQIQNDPFVKLSLSFCALLIGGTLIIELYSKLKKAPKSNVLLYPQRFSHHPITRKSLILQLQDKLKELHLQCKDISPVLYIIGPPGCGKTELVYQYIDHYVKELSHKRIKAVSPTVFTVNATSSQQLRLSLAEVAHCLGLKHVSADEDMFSAIISELGSTGLPWLLVVDNLTKEADSFFRSISKCLSVSTDSSTLGTVLVTCRSDVDTVRDHTFSVSSRYHYVS